MRWTRPGVSDYISRHFGSNRLDFILQNWISLHLLNNFLSMEQTCFFLSSALMAAFFSFWSLTTLNFSFTSVAAFKSFSAFLEFSINSSITFFDSFTASRVLLAFWISPLIFVSSWSNSLKTKYYLKAKCWTLQAFLRLSLLSLRNILIQRPMRVGVSKDTLGGWWNGSSLRCRRKLLGWKQLRVL